MSNKEIEQQNMIEKQGINSAIDNSCEQLLTNEDVIPEKIEIAKKIILTSLGWKNY